jgi:F-type H+-transporting ATPase subunit b
MSIDWITVVAQIVNFLVLVWLLKRFLYRPILDGIDAREAEITDRMHEAVAAKDKATAREVEYQEKVHALNVSQSQMSETIRKSAEDQRDALLAEARQKLEREEADWQAHLDTEAQKYSDRLHHAGGDALLSLTRKALTDLADDTFENRMAQHLIAKIKPMADDLKRAAGDANGATVTSHETLTKATQKNLSSDLNAIFPKTQLTFDTDNTQSAGLVLRIGGAQIAWTVDTYIDGLGAMLRKQMAAGPSLKVNPDAA